MPENKFREALINRECIMSPNQRINVVLFILFLLLMINGCANVKPYQREILSTPEMQFDYEKSENAARDHFLNSLEGSVGGFGTGGGGCGCN